MDIQIDGFSSDELLALLSEPDYRRLVFSNELIVFRVGSAEVLARFKEKEGEIAASLGHVDGGGEGVLMKTQNLLRAFGRQNGYKSIAWTVYAVNCPNPNPKLRKVLELRGYQVQQTKGGESVFFKKENL